MRQAGLLEPVQDYGCIARTTAILVERTGLPGLAGVWGGPQLAGRHFLGFGTQAQRAEWGARMLAVAISEPNVGAHPKLLTTQADRVPGGFRINGRKAWVTNGPSADAIIVFAITVREAGRKRFSAFIVPRDLPRADDCRDARIPCFAAVPPLAAEPGGLRSSRSRTARRAGLSL